MSGKSKRRRPPDDGRPLPVHYQDQVDGAIAETLQRTLGAAHEVSIRPGPVTGTARKLNDAYSHAVDVAEARYKESVPAGKRVPGRTLWGQCEHLADGGPQPSHWSPVFSTQLFCDKCWAVYAKMYTDGGACFECGELGLTSVRHFAINQIGTTVTAHVFSCGDCYRG